jgi:hypothetical protein
MGNGLADGVCDRLRREHGPFLMATGTQATLPAGEGHEHLVPAVRTTDPREAKVQVAAAEKGACRVADHGTPGTIARGIPVVVGLFELRQEPLDHLIERRGARLARTIDV